MIKVLIADDHAIVRDILRFLLDSADDIQVLAMASNGQEAVAQAALHCPDVAVIDVSMPTMDGVEATKKICAHCPHTRILMISMRNKWDYVQTSLRAGASGYVLKDDAAHDLITAVRSLHQGKRYFSKQISDIAKRFL